jgi:hypothetical protein
MRVEFAFFAAAADATADGRFNVLGGWLDTVILEPFDFRLFQDLGAACDQATR